MLRSSHDACGCSTQTTSTINLKRSTLHPHEGQADRPNTPSDSVNPGSNPGPFASKFVRHVRQLLPLHHIASHTASARGKGMTDEQFAELLAVIGLANETNRVAIGYGVPIDDRFQTLKAASPQYTARRANAIEQQCRSNKSSCSG